MDGNIYRLWHQNQLLGVECSCRHRTVFSPAELVQMSNVGEMEGLDRLLRLMRCSLCGAKDAKGVALSGLDAAIAWEAESLRRAPKAK